ncbi:MAG: SPFH domain-containing protein [Firmicutes bacterium]|nr:SPFH domain-containing protein [Bacillota bacterium]
MAIVEVVKYSGNPNVFAWKYPNEELGTWTQLIVNESQEAVLFKGGKALDVFQSGKHTLDTENIPILNKIINLPFGGRSPFSAEVWYINKVNSLDIKWGTSSPIQLQDPKYSIFVPVRAFGQFGIRIDDSKKFLVKLVGTLPMFDQESIVKYFKGIYLTKVKDVISSYLIHKKISIMEINAYINELSLYIQEKVGPIFDEYGIKLINFYVNDISVPEDDSAVKKLKDALAKRAEMEILGYNYQQERSFDTLEGAAKNSGSSANIMGAGIGLGMGVNMGSAFGNQFGGIVKNIDIDAQNGKPCPECGAMVPAGKRFCPDCGCEMKNKEENVDNSSVICSNCGTKYKKTMKFCPECGDKYNPCPKCGKDLNEGVEICPECGYEKPKPCPHCGTLLPDSNVKFCPECGQSLMKVCPKCNANIVGDSKFCPECGEKL